MAPPVSTVDVGSSASAYYAAATVSSSSEVIHISGQPGTNAHGDVPSDYESQIQLALLNLRKIILAAGSKVSDILKLTVYIVNYDPAKRKHTRHLQKFLGAHRPAITLVPVPQLAVKGWLFEIDAVVARSSAPAPRIPSQVSSKATENVDVVVIGAGLAGLAAANKVIEAGLSCIVLEARDRVGGRTWSQPLADGNGIIDLGAAWINDTNQSRMIALARKYGAELIEQNTTGDCVLQDVDGSISSFPYGDLPKFSEETRKHVASIRDMVEADCQKIDCPRPQDAALDSLSFEAYLRSRGASEVAINTAAVWTRAMLGQEPGDVSALYFLNYCKSGGGLLQMRSDRQHGGQYLRVRQGTQLFSKGLASELPEGVLRLSTPVKSVKQIGSRHVAVEAAGHSILARKVISAVPLMVLRAIEFEPALPLKKKILTDSFKYGYYTKVMMVFKTPFWVEKGFCGLVQSFTGPSSVIRDTSVPADKKWVLTCFLAGDSGRQWAALGENARTEALLNQVGEVFGVKDRVRAEFVESLGHEWINEEYSGYGCPCPSLGPGVLDTVGDALREPFGNVHFACTDTAEEWKGYMEGAVRSGERGAKEVQEGLKQVVAKL